MIGKLIKKDIERRIRQPVGYLILIALPLLFALLIGLVFGPKRSDDGLIRVNMLIEDHDSTFTSKFLTGAFGQGELKNMFDITIVDSGEGRPMMNEGKASALLIIPTGFGDSLLHQNHVAITLIKNPSESFAPKIAEETVQILAEAGDRLIGVVEGPLKTIRNRVDSDSDFTEPEMILMAVQSYRLIKKVENILFPPLIQLKSSTDEEKKNSTDSSTLFAYAICNMLAMSLLFSLEVLNRDIFLERENHTLTRQQIASGTFSFVLAKMIFIYLSGLVSFALVWIIGIPLFGISISLDQIIRLAVFSLVFIAGLTGVIAFIYAVAKTRSQAQSIAPAVIIAFSMMGGVMIRVNSLPLFMQKIAVISPIYWGIDAMHKILLGTATLKEIAPNMGVLGLLAMIFLIPSLIIQQRKLRS